MRIVAVEGVLSVDVDGTDLVVSANKVSLDLVTSDGTASFITSLDAALVRNAVPLLKNLWGHSPVVPLEITASLLSQSDLSESDALSGSGGLVGQSGGSDGGDECSKLHLYSVLIDY